jgi:REP element-mobilizing transposase RayT
MCCTCPVMEPYVPASARRDIVQEECVGVYHCIARCVRRAFLCGTDTYSGRDYSHRKAWIIDRLRHLAGLFGIDVCSYAIMSNHLHLVLRNRPDRVEQWSDAEVALRWRKLFPQLDDVTGEPAEPDDLDLAMLMADAGRLAILRGRLSSLSWFMRCLCEWVARAANREENSAGRFWAGRFKSQPLLDEAALLACSVYVDLNPIRAGIASTPEESQFTSGCDRILSFAGPPGGFHSSHDESSAETSDRPDPWLCELTLRETEVVSRTGQSGSSPAEALETVPPREPIASNHEDGAGRSAPARSSAAVSAVPRQAESKRPLPARASDQGFLPIETRKYVMLLDWTGRELRLDKRGAIPEDLAPILDRLGVDRSNWVDTVRDFGRMFKQAAGRASSLVQAAPRCSRRWLQGKAAAQVAFL